MCLSDANRFHPFLSCGLSGQVLRLTVRRGRGLTKLKHTFGRVVQQPALTYLAISANGRFRSATYYHQSRITHDMQQVLRLCYPGAGHLQQKERRSPGAILPEG